jgi:MFS superfamily sulfate permease-like transporter
MGAMAQFAVLTLTTIFSGILAFGMAWALLLGAFHLMRPAAVRRSRTSAPRVSREFRSGLVPGTRAAARQFALHR